MRVDPNSDTDIDIDLPSPHLHLVCDLLQTYLPGIEVWAYGSRVRGNARQYSDLDLVAFTEPEHAHQLALLREAFEESDLPFRVDLFAWHATPSSFHPQIKRNYVVIQSGSE